MIVSREISLLFLYSPGIQELTLALLSSPAKYAILVKYAEGVCRAVGIKYGMGHCELKATFDEKRQKWVE